MKKIFIAEEVPSINKGESAILWGTLESLDIIGKIDVSLCTDSVELDRAEYGSAVRLIADNVPKPDRLLGYAGLLVRHLFFISLYLLFGKHAVKIMRAPLWQEYLTADLIVLGHDNRLVGRGPLSLLAVPVVAKTLGKPSIVFCGTVGPFSNGFSRRAAKFILDWVDLITLREKKSLETLDCLGIDLCKATVTADPAFLMRPVDNRRVREILSHEGVTQDRPLIGLTITQEMAGRYAKVHSPGDLGAGYHAYMKLMANVLDMVIRKTAASVLILNHCTGPETRHDDRLASRDVACLVEEKDQVFVIEGNYTARELKGLIGACELLIGHRTHSLIAAVSMHLPVVAVSSKITGSKTRGIVGDMLQLDTWILDVETVDEVQFIDKVNSAWEQRLIIQSHLQQNIPVVQAKARVAGEKAFELLQGRK